MSSRIVNRRDAMKIGLGLVALPGLRAFAGQGPAATPQGPGRGRGQPQQTETGAPIIYTRSSYPRGQWYYDPVGLFIPKGQTVRWVCTAWGVTVTAFHPDNDNHELRIPAGAKPFDSGLMGSAYRNTFEYTFEVEGTYDYFSRSNEVLGMVGRVIVGSPGGPGEQPPGYGGREGRAPMYPPSAKLLLAIDSKQIVAKKVIPYPTDLLVRTHPYGTIR